jgi:hypothetical protein
MKAVWNKNLVMARDWGTERIVALASMLVVAPTLVACAGGAENETAPNQPGGSSGAAGNSSVGGTSSGGAAGTGVGIAGTAGTSGGGSAGSAGTGGAPVAGTGGTGGNAGSGGASAGTSGAGTGGASAGSAGATAGTAGAGGSGDTGLPFGEPCGGDDECESGQCIEGPNGTDICTQPCVDDCPEDFRCAKLSGSGDDEGYCVPRFARLCHPCTSDSDCRLDDVPSESSRCLPYGDGAEGSYCGATCSDTDACADGYTCELISTPSGNIKQCRPDGGALCECEPGWADKGYTTTCFEKNGWGTCTGTRDCDTGALSDCSAETPAAEVCDGKDNNCNAAVDDGYPCDDGLPCTSDACGGVDGCEYDLVAGACQIGFACFADGDTNPTNACERCISTRSTTNWTGQADSCSIGGVCYFAGDKNPENSCQVCNPGVSTSVWTTAGNACLIGGACYGDGDVQSGDICSVCSPDASKSSWSANLGVGCDDGNACTTNDACQGNRTCKGTLANDGGEPANDALPGTDLGKMRDCDVDETSAVGILVSGDTDWYAGRGEDAILCAVNPALNVNSNGSVVRACVYLNCDSGDNDVDCKDGSTGDNTLSDYAGCCKTGINPAFNMGHNCKGFLELNESSEIRIRIDALNSLQCSDYSYDFHF